MVTISQETAIPLCISYKPDRNYVTFLEKPEISVIYGRAHCG